MVRSYSNCYSVARGEQLSNALRCYTRYKNGNELDQLERAARGSGEALTASELLEENFLAARLHLATEYVLLVVVSEATGEERLGYHSPLEQADW